MGEPQEERIANIGAAMNDMLSRRQIVKLTIHQGCHARFLLVRYDIHNARQAFYHRILYTAAIYKSCIRSQRIMTIHNKRNHHGPQDKDNRQ